MIAFCKFASRLYEMNTFFENVAPVRTNPLLFGVSISNRGRGGWEPYPSKVSRPPFRIEVSFLRGCAISYNAIGYFYAQASQMIRVTFAPLRRNGRQCHLKRKKHICFDTVFGAATFLHRHRKRWGSPSCLFDGIVCFFICIRKNTMVLTRFFSQRREDY